MIGKSNSSHDRKSKIDLYHEINLFISNSIG